MKESVRDPQASGVGVLSGDRSGIVEDEKVLQRLAMNLEEAESRFGHRAAKALKAYVAPCVRPALLLAGSVTASAGSVAVVNSAALWSGAGGGGAAAAVAFLRRRRGWRGSCRASTSRTPTSPRWVDRHGSGNRNKSKMNSATKAGGS